MEFRELEAFVAVAEELHFGRAASRLHLSQPALSQQIQRLEADLGATLLNRSSREVSLTPAGAVFLDRCRALLGGVAQAVEDTRRMADGRSGHVDVGYVGSALYGLLPDVVARMRRLHPGVELTLTERKTAPQISLLVAGEQDVGIIHRPDTSPTGLVMHDLEVNDVMIALPAGHPLADGDSALQWADLTGTPFVLFPAAIEPDTHAMLHRKAVQEGLTIDVVQEAVGLPTILGLVAAGVGAAFVVDAVAAHAPPLGIAFRRLQRPSEIVTAVMWDPDSVNPAVGTLLQTFGASGVPG